MKSLVELVSNLWSTKYTACQVRLTVSQWFQWIYQTVRVYAPLPQLFHPSLQSLFDQAIMYLHPKACFVTCTNFGLNRHNGFEERETINGIQKDRYQFVNYWFQLHVCCKCNRNWLTVDFVVFCLHPKACINCNT